MADASFAINKDDFMPSGATHGCISWYPRTVPSSLEQAAAQKLSSYLCLVELGACCVLAKEGLN